jgi:hypothetical protein
MRSQLEIVYGIDMPLFHCVQFAKSRNYANMCVASGETIIFSPKDFILEAPTFIERSLVACENNFVTFPNPLFSDDKSLANIQRDCMVIIFSRVASKKGDGIQVRSVYPQRDRYTIAEPLTSRSILDVLELHFRERFGEQTPYPWL